MHVKVLISNLEFTKSQSKLSSHESSQLVILNLQFPLKNNSNQDIKISQW